MSWIKTSIVMLTVMAAALPMQAYACSVCFTGKEGFMKAFYQTTVFLILLPPMIAGSFAWYLWKTYKKAKAEQALEEEQEMKAEKGE